MGNVQHILGDGVELKCMQSEYGFRNSQRRRQRLMQDWEHKVLYLMF